MNNKLKFIAGSIAGVGMALAMSVASFAQTVTPPVMDADVKEASDALVTGIVTSLGTQFGTVLAVGGALLVTIISVYFLIRHFRRVVHA
jgi:hypothetical protein